MALLASSTVENITKPIPRPNAVTESVRFFFNFAKRKKKRKTDQDVAFGDVAVGSEQTTQVVSSEDRREALDEQVVALRCCCRRRCCCCRRRCCCCRRRCRRRRRRVVAAFGAVALLRFLHRAFLCVFF